MSKKMMLLAAGALTALAFAALPAIASAGEWESDPAGSTFTASSVGKTFLTTTGENTVECASSTGHGQYNAGSSTTGTIDLLFTGCKSAGTACTTSGLTSGTITAAGNFTNGYLGSSPGTPLGVKIEGPNHGKLAEFKCAFGFVTVRVEGSVIGELEGAECGEENTTFSIEFASTEPGHQKWMQFTESGEATDLKSIQNNGTPETASQDGTGELHFTKSQTITCP